MDKTKSDLQFNADELTAIANAVDNAFKTNYMHEKEHAELMKKIKLAYAESLKQEGA